MTEDGRLLAADSKLTYLPVDVQLKATYTDLVEINGVISYPLDIKQYDKLRLEMVGSPRLLVLLRLPKDHADWLRVNAEALVARRCAYWVSLRGAEAITGQDSRAVYIPTANVLTPEALTEIMTRFSRQEVISYAS